MINLSPDKPQVFRDALRILKPGGRLAVSDVVATVELPEAMRSDPQLVSSCIGNASLVEDLETMMRDAGFVDVRIAPKDESRNFIRDWAPGQGIEDYVVSATIEAVKPVQASLAFTGDLTQFPQAPTQRSDPDRRADGCRLSLRSHRRTPAR